MLRTLENVNLKDRVRSVDMLKKNKILSVNQMMAQIKITEVWKSQNIKNYSTIWTKRNEVIKRTGLKCTNKSELVINGKSYLQSQTFYNDAAKIWNEAPAEIKMCKPLATARKGIRKFVVSLPI